MLDSAISVFADLGYRSASMDTIARDAGVSKPMLYLYYGSKEELFSACVTRESGRLIDQLTTAAVAGSGPRDRLEGVVQSFLEYVDQRTDSWNVVYRQSFAEPAFRGEVEKIRSDLVDLTTDLLQQHWGDERGRRSCRWSPPRSSVRVRPWQTASPTGPCRRRSPPVSSWNSPGAASPATH
ncbi:TetR/AcrR family transcriptional regulator [Dietzia aerolata]|uniref:TetR/AcrR family transcriptional regulator n=1 Tax=Dietzia aerolata TaxID=595984 RepID=UPI003637EB53